MRALLRAYVVATLLTAGCGSNAPANARSSATLTIGLGSTATAQGEATGLRQVANLFATDRLVSFAPDGLPVPALAAGWSYSSDGLTFTLRLAEATFHDGTPLTAALVRDLLASSLPRFLGPAFDDVQEIRAQSDREILFTLKRPSRLIVEALDIPVEKPGAALVGTGPFQTDDSGEITQLVANRHYSGGRVPLDRIVLRPYPSVRAAWADLLRGNVDMLFEVGVDALPSLEPSTRAKVFSYGRYYQYMVLFNLKAPALRSSALRRELNAAVDRERLIAEGLGNQGVPSQGPLWPGYWAAPADLRPIDYAPRWLSDAARPIRLSCLLVDPSHERVAIALQRQLRSVGVQLDLQLDDASVALRRVSEGNFDVAMFEAISAPTLLRPYLFWHSKGPYNFGGFASTEVDAALDDIRHAVNDDTYKAGVAAFQRAIMNDPPAIFLAWSERARAISTAFNVPVEPGRDPLTTIRDWRPVGPVAVPSSN